MDNQVRYRPANQQSNKKLNRSVPHASKDIDEVTKFATPTVVKDEGVVEVDGINEDMLEVKLNEKNKINILASFNDNRKVPIDLNSNDYFLAKVRERFLREEKLKKEKKSNKSSASSLRNSNSTASQEKLPTTSQRESSSRQSPKTQLKSTKQSTTANQNIDEKVTTFMSTIFSIPVVSSPRVTTQNESVPSQKSEQSIVNSAYHVTPQSIESAEQNLECEVINTALRKVSITSGSLVCSDQLYPRTVPILTALKLGLVCPSDTPSELRREVIGSGEVGYGYRLMENPLPQKLWRSQSRKKKLKRKKKQNNS